MGGAMVSDIIDASVSLVQLGLAFSCLNFLYA